MDGGCRLRTTLWGHEATTPPTLGTLKQFVDRSRPHPQRSIQSDDLAVQHPGRTTAKTTPTIITQEHDFNTTEQSIKTTVMTISTTSECIARTTAPVIDDALHEVSKLIRPAQSRRVRHRGRKLCPHKFWKTLKQRRHEQACAGGEIAGGGGRKRGVRNGLECAFCHPIFVERSKCLLTLTTMRNLGPSFVAGCLMTCVEQLLSSHMIKTVVRSVKEELQVQPFYQVRAAARRMSIPVHHHHRSVL